MRSFASFVMKLIFLSIFTTALECRFAYCQDAIETSETFSDNYYGFEAVRNHPVSYANREFASGDLSAMFTFKHLLSEQWMVGVSTGFKRLFVLERGSHLSMFTVGNESLRIVRISHPLYLMLGPKLFYMLPTKNKKIPFEDDEEFNREYGVGFSLALQFRFRSLVLVGLRAERWRGINRDLFQGTETALTVSFPFRTK